MTSVLFKELRLTSEGEKTLLEYPCDAAIKTDVLYNGKSVFMVRYNGKCGIMDSTGCLIVPPIYDSIIAPSSFKDRNTFCVDSYSNPQRGNKDPWGAIRLDGTQITETFAFSYMFGFKYGHCIVKIRRQEGEDYAVIDTNGKFFIPFGTYVNMFYTGNSEYLKAETKDGITIKYDAKNLIRL